MKNKKQGVVELLVWACVAVIGITLLVTQGSDSKDNNNNVREETTSVSSISSVI